MFKELGIIGIIIFLICIGLVSFIATILVGAALATKLGFTGIVWWAFVFVFYLVIATILNFSRKVIE